jgi:RNA polymerase sigma-70 factor (ECF subfamily)
MTRVAMYFVRDLTVAEEVVQEAWVAVLRGLEAFEGRSSLRTWIFRIVSNLAKSRGARERRTIPFSGLIHEADDGEAGVSADRFLADGRWSSAPRSWGLPSDERAVSSETLAVVRTAVEGLPSNQRAVVVLRDVEGWSGRDVCALLDVSDANQRVLLHRGRARIRRALEAYFES